MADIVDPATRSRMMASIRAKNTKPEMLVRHALHKLGLRYRLHDRTLPGSPDLVFPKHKAALFVHGCFWHRHDGCRYAYEPKSHVGEWQSKFRRNMERDVRNRNELIALGWRVLIVWECSLRNNLLGSQADTLAIEIREGTQLLSEW